MAKLKFDGLIDAVRLAPDGKIVLVRAYERRGSTYSDNILIDRASLVNRLKSGEKFVTGSRKEFLGSTFDVVKTVHLAANGEFITTGSDTNHDLLEEVPSL
jgi:hypothetical protein